MNRFQVVATDPEQILNLTMDRQQSLGVGNRFESANLAFFLSCVLVRDLSSVVFVLASPMLNGREDLAMRCRVAPELVSDQLPWRFFWPFNTLRKKRLAAFLFRRFVTRMSRISLS